MSHIGTIPELGYIETFAKCPFLPNFCVPDNRDLSTGSNFNPQNTQCIPVVKIIAFLELRQKLTFCKGLIVYIRVEIDSFLLKPLMIF